MYIKDRKVSARYNNKLRTFNNLFSVLIAFMALYVIFAPLLPKATIWISQKSDHTQGFKYQSVLAKEELKPAQTQDLKATPDVNTLVIPSIGVDGEVYEGENAESALALGLWHRPLTSTPEKGGNTVIAAHRYQYTSGPKTFYSLDKVVTGDNIILFWRHTDGSIYEHDYAVSETKIVEPTEVSIEDQTTDDRLTLFTCTPLYTATQRLVVIAKPTKVTKVVL